MTLFTLCLFVCLQCLVIPLFSVCSNMMPELHLPAGSFMLDYLVNGDIDTGGVAVPYSMNNGWSQQLIVCATQSKHLFCLLSMTNINLACSYKQFPNPSIPLVQ